MLKTLGEALTSKNVQRQAYHEQSFIGNYVNKMLKLINFNSKPLW